MRCAALCLWLATFRHPALPGVSDRFRAGRPSARLGDAAYRPADRRARLVRTPGFAADLDSRRAMTPAGEVFLTPAEWRLLEVLTSHPGRIVSPAQLQHEVWRAPAGGRLDHVAAAMTQLRHKLEPDPSRPPSPAVPAGGRLLVPAGQRGPRRPRPARPPRHDPRQR